MIEYRVKNADKPYQYITYAYWYPEFVWNRGSMSKEHEYLGFWIKFEDNFDYSYGYFETVMGGGRYHFRLDDNAMIMVDNDILIEPKIWTANHNGEAIALIGTHELGINNGMQIKLVPLDNQPSRG
jgi:hypothetical protein